MGFMKLMVYFDGSCGPVNPGGIAAYGFVIKNEDGDLISRGSGRACRGKSASNNVGEYFGLIQSMKEIVRHYPDAEVTFNGDSTLVIAQMKGEAKAKKGLYLPFYREAKALALPYIQKHQWHFRWIQRALNSEADNLAQYHRY